MLQDALRLLILCLVGWAVYNRFFGKIAGAKARELVSGGALLLDVRTQAEFASGHLDGAKNVPVSELSARVGELGSARPVVVYCASGMRSASAKRKLRKAGFKEVFDLGGMSRW